MALPRVPGHGLSLAYREWNADAGGLPLVLLHGITGSSADWRGVANHLNGVRVVALDARGHGESDWDPDEGYAGDQHFADVATALDTFNIGRCVIAGFSMGGSVAIITAAALPERVAGVIVVDAYPAPEMTPGSRRIAGWVAHFEAVGGWFDPALARRFREQLEAGVESRLDLWPMWEALECPALVVRGELSDVLPASLAEEMLRRQPRAELVTLPGVGHPIVASRPKELAHTIREFMLKIG